MANREKRMVTIFKGNGSPMISVKQERNKPCPCGSGKKAKKCCGIETKFYNTNKNRTYEKNN